MSKKEKLKIKSYGWLKWLLAVFFLLAIIIFAYAYFYHIVYAQKFYPGFKLGNNSLAGKNYLEGLDLINAYTDEVDKNGLVYVFDWEKVSVLPLVSAAGESDLTFEIFKFNEEGTIDEAYDYSRQGNLVRNFLKHISALISGVKVNLKYELDENELEKIITANFAQFETPAVDAHLKVVAAGQYVVIPEKEGKIFDYQEIIKQTQENIKNINNKSLNLSLVTDYPRVKKSETNDALAQVTDILALAPINITYGEKKWEINSESLQKFIDFKYKDQKVVLGFNAEFADYLTETIAKEIERPVKEGKFEINEGKVTEFQASEPGLTVDVEKTTDDTENAVFGDKKTTVTLAVKEISPVVTTESINELGVKELIGQGESNFKGSPKNRRHNIAVGAAALHGLLVKPGEEFSLVKALGKIEASTGYLQELVIKGNKTVPEYGGGLCQIGTTAFRLALNAGLPILERKPHSYRVSYYEPAGTDATIYDPKPDLRFKNDTGHYLLWQTRIEGDVLYFEFYGTSDGRKVEMTKPVLSNFVSPGPTKIVETTDLAPGEKKCTERAHIGANAVFYRTVTYVDGRQEKETWSSYYKPWQEVCLVGKAE
ncbi:MAG: VanW family protein [Patescibacteria group bacterium]